MRLAILLCLFVVTGCEVERGATDGASTDAETAEVPMDPETEALEPATRGTDVVTSESPDAVEAPPSAPVYTLRRLVTGDRACYVDLQPVDAEIETRLADFGVCAQAEVEDLVGQPVQIEVGEADVMAESCEGDPECTDFETVELITRLFAAE